MTWSRLSSLFRSNTDARLEAGLLLGAGVSAGLILLIVAFLLQESWPALRADGGWRFFSGGGWYPLSGEFNLTPMLVGTLAASAGALVLAVPLGIAGAIFSVFHAPAGLAGVFQKLLGLMGGLPSVVYGFWGLTVLVPLIARWQPPGTSLLAAALILALMILPTVMLTSQAALKAVPSSYLLGAAALGMRPSGAILRVALPAARSGILAGILLAAARALGETMAVMMVAGNVPGIPTGLFEPVRVLTANIALEMAYATGQHRAALYVSGLMLTALVALLALSAHRLGRSTRHA